MEEDRRVDSSGVPVVELQVDHPRTSCCVFYTPRRRACLGVLLVDGVAVVAPACEVWRARVDVLELDARLVAPIWCCVCRGSVQCCSRALRSLWYFVSCDHFLV